MILQMMSLRVTSLKQIGTRSRKYTMVKMKHHQKRIRISLKWSGNLVLTSDALMLTALIKVKMRISLSVDTHLLEILKVNIKIT